MLFRFRAQQAADLGIIDAGRARRPKIITEVNSIPTCEKWRGHVLKEISRKVSRIQEPNLSDYQIRDLNDEINKAMREKHMWEVQIRNLGGPNYMRGGRVYDDEGKEIPGGGKGYRYVDLEKCKSTISSSVSLDTLEGRENFRVSRSCLNQRSPNPLINHWQVERIYENKWMLPTMATILMRRMVPSLPTKLPRKKRPLKISWLTGKIRTQIGSLYQEMQAMAMAGIFLPWKRYTKSL